MRETQKTDRAAGFGPYGRLRFLTGVSNPDVEAWASSRQDEVGVVISPLIPQYGKRLVSYRHVMIDNGAFSKTTPFSASKFEALLDTIAASEDLRSRIDFVVAPDVPGDMAATLRLFDFWEPIIHAKGLPVALAIQNGLERMDAEALPWGRFDWLFVGGEDRFKLGAWNELEVVVDDGAPLFRGEELTPFVWANQDGIPIHVGRVNSAKRMLWAKSIGATSVDGTFLHFAGTKKREDGKENGLDRLAAMLAKVNGPAAAPATN